MTTADYADLPRLISLMTGDGKHAAAAQSTVDVLWVLYDRVLDLTPETFREPGRDRFLLSKGHGPMAYYAVLTAKGFLDEAELASWSSARSRLGHHPDRRRVPGVEISSGSLGHGLPIAVGTALGARARGHTGRVVTLIGDAEFDEGSNHEAVVLAGRLGLEQLTTVVVDNQSSSHGWPGGIARRFEVEGWQARTVSGRDHEALYEAFTTAHPGRPLAVVAVVEPKG
ncbi:thiamine pyrophosphate-dependent enzyme [Amycolatopsis sp. PS_44_ISF1]|uniref:thiamine pyrophosphate-dependent enzyme n=1 Tax=Amycolatopsis sp. PS_44_ISF1 TaxID=2974917 RepID=UPI0028DF8F54|nr:thiamine pyrophosphate-dependent enzyme [Amycolatopsis sp. PS_44_ISF1]MDT8914336.1 thiamine pyrophosphate-dependent enzyme [Amycolatopsis sp. PS_44_ISF1]